MIEPRLRPGSAGEVVPEATIDSAGTRPAEADTSAGGLLAAGDVWGWLAMYLGLYPRAVVKVGSGVL